MNIFFLKKNLTFFLVLWSSFFFAQKKVVVKYFENHKKLPIENVQFFLVTKTDTLALKIVKGKIQLQKNMKENFSLFAKVDNEMVIKVGSFRPSAFEEKDEIVIGRITDFSKIKTSWEFADTFVIDKNYLIEIPNSNTIADLIYSIVVKYVDISPNSYSPNTIPKVTTWYEIIKTNN